MRSAECGVISLSRRKVAPTKYFQGRKMGATLRRECSAFFCALHKKRRGATLGSPPVIFYFRSVCSSGRIAFAPRPSTLQLKLGEAGRSPPFTRIGSVLFSAEEGVTEAGPGVPAASAVNLIG
jgi:hypothetical protein